MAEKLVLRKGDKIVVTKDGEEHAGTVITAQNYGWTPESPDWYIEFRCEDHGYHYWKQSLDGGTVVKVGGTNG